MKNIVVYVHGKGGSAEEAGHWFHTEEQMRFLDRWIAASEKEIQP